MSILVKNKEFQNTKFFIREYKVVKQIGEGSYASIYKVQKDNSNEIYVLKQIPITEEDLNDTQNLNDIKNESLILSKIHSPYILKFYDSFFYKNCLNIITEYCSAGDLSDYLSMYISHKKKMSEKLIWKLFIQICLGLYYLHSHKILHRDIKTKNIFLNDDFSIKIGDLGIAKILENTSSYAYTFIGTPYYLSPELCKDLPYNDKSDVWSLGCVLYEMTTLKHPFEGKTKVEIYEKIINSNYEGIDKYYSLELRRIIDLLLIKDEKKRPKISDILTLSIIKEKAKENGIKIPEIKPKNINNNCQNKNNPNINSINNSSNDLNCNISNNSNLNCSSNYLNTNSTNNFGNNSGNYNNNINESFSKNYNKKIKISTVEVNYFKYKNEKNNHNKENKQQLESSGKNSSKFLKQNQEKLINIMSKKKNSSKENNQNKENKGNKEIFNYNNININNNYILNNNLNNKIQLNLNKNRINAFNINLSQRPISGNVSRKNEINSQQYIKNSSDNHIKINDNQNINIENKNEKYLKKNVNINNNENQHNSDNNSNEHYKKHQIHNIINYNNNIKIQLHKNQNYKNLTEVNENETNKSTENSNLNNEINSSKNLSNVSNDYGKGKMLNKNYLIKKVEEKKKSNVLDIIQKVKQIPPMALKKNIEPINNIKIEERNHKKMDSNNFTLTENNDMLLFNTNASEKNNLKKNEEKVKVFNANDTLIYKTESQLKKDTINLLNLKNKYLNFLNESKNEMIEISNDVFENVLKMYKKLDSNPDNIDSIYEEIQNYIIENIPLYDENKINLYKKFNKAFSNYVYFEIELKDIDKKIQKRKLNSKWYIN